MTFHTDTLVVRVDGLFVTVTSMGTSELVMRKEFWLNFDAVLWFKRYIETLA